MPNPEKRLCIDEQMIPFKGRLDLKQYMKGKQIPGALNYSSFVGNLACHIIS